MGDDPATSVVDRDCKAWSLDNLYVADASVFPSSAAVNPTLTIVANAMRVSERLKTRFGISFEAPAPAPTPQMRPGAKVFERAQQVSPPPQAKQAKRNFWPFGVR
jgi:choline dehydrogenase-like flavoprotein